MEPVATTTTGKVRGRIEEGAAVFLGIPFADPPTGEGWYVAPAPVTPWSGTRDSLAYGASAPQAERLVTLIPEPIIEGKNCLNLNVFTPELGAAALPVLVFIHGGGSVAGCNASPWYHGTRFARDGVVVVNINYRLGPQGFGHRDGSPPNRAVLDQVAALGWVRDNIEAFGGDPTKVTISGQSAGGLACATLLATPSASGLFRSAILMSGAGPIGHRPRAEGEGFGPYVDGDVVVATPKEAVAGMSSHIPLMVGATAEEGVATMRAAGDKIDEARSSRRLARMGLSESHAAAYRAARPEASLAEVLGQATTDWMFRVPSLRLAEARTGVAGGAGAWSYDFRWRTAVRNMGAVHCLDVPFAFDVLDASGVAEVAGPTPPQHLADEVHGAWVHFVKGGDPGWPPYELERRPTKLYDDESSVADDPLRFERELWAGIR